MSGKRIFLSLMPFWAPLNPPLGISLLKSYLKIHGVNVEIYDFNTEDELWQILDRYFKILAEAIPQHRQSNFHMIAYDVLSNHLTAYLHKTQESKYHELLKILIRKNYFTEINKNVLIAMDKAISDFYAELSKSLIKVFNAVRPDVFGISVYSTSLGPSIFAFKLIKEKFPGVETVMGGGVFADHLSLNSTNLSVFLKRTESYIDTVIIGEGERLFLDYLSGELKSHERVYSLKDIHNQNLDLHRMPIPDFSELNLAAYSQMVTYASRSCPFQCNFCSETIQWGQFRTRKGEQIVHEIDSIKRKYGGKLFMFGDSLMNQVVTELSHDLIKRQMDIYWDGYLRADSNVCEAGNTDLWRRAGLYRARLGIESGSQRVLNLMNKRITNERIKKAISNLANSGIKTSTYWVIGYPGETEEDFNETLRLLEQLKDDIYEADWHPFYFFPDGQVHSLKWTKEYGIELLYPEEFSDLLLTQTWTLCTSPGREELFERMNRVAELCKKLDIPNSYSMMNIYLSDKRWKNLHPNCGPTLLELHNYRHLA